MANDGAPCNAIELNNIRLEYGDGPDRFAAVDGVDLTVTRGEFVAIVGRSGCGKTSLLNVATGMVKPSSGTVRVLGGSPSVAHDRFAYMLARDALMPWRTAERNVQLPLELQNVPRSEARERARRQLADVGLAGSEHKFPWQLSQGMRQRVALARTWANDPELLLVDEPFSALDAQTSEDVRIEFLKKWESKRASVLFVTHDLPEAIMLADRVILMRAGRVVLQVPIPFDRPRATRELERTPEFQEILSLLLSELK
jgi:NitT/TauT family transport system ATP-binding protein